MVFFSRIFFRTPTRPEHEKQVPNNDNLDSVQQDKRGGTITADFVTGDDDAAMVESVDSSVPDNSRVNSNPGQSKYGRTYMHTTHYDPMTGCTIGAEATTIANYYQCPEDTDGKVEFANIKAGIGEGFESTMKLKPMNYEEALNGPA